MRREPEIHSCDSPVCLVVGFRLKWRFSNEELVGEDTQRPQVNFSSCISPSIISGGR